MSSNKKINAVAIDGPAGSGKSTISKMVAKKLGFTYIDTGAMYRACTLKAMRSGVDLSDEASLVEISYKIDIKITPSDVEGQTTAVILDGVDVSKEIRVPDVTRNVKYLAKLPGVRENLVAKQRKMAAKNDGSVMEGRDIGTVVLFNAKYKIYLDASFDERVDRRYKELLLKGSDVNRDELAKDLKERDDSDFNREVGALKKAEDAHIVDTTGLSIEQVVDKIVKIVKG